MSEHRAKDYHRGQDSAITRITAGVKARRRPSPAKFRSAGRAFTLRVGSVSDEKRILLSGEYPFVRRYLERNPQLPLSLRQVDPLIRELTVYRDLIEERTKENPE